MSRAAATDSQNVHSQEGKHETLLVRGRRLFVIGRLGEGSYSIVYLVQDPKTLRRYALKRLAVRREEELPRLIEEMERTERLSHHPFVCACYAYEVACVDGVHYASMLLQHGGNPLVTLMKERQLSGENGGFFKQQDVIRLAMQIGSALSFMHHQEPPIAHRDVKAENIMESRGVFRLVDFGSASTVAYEPRTSSEFLKVQGDVTSQTTMAYRAPEMCDVYRKHRIDQHADVWAMGVLLYYIMYFQLPFEETNLSILGGNYKLPPQPLASSTTQQTTERNHNNHNHDDNNHHSQSTTISRPESPTGNTVPRLYDPALLECIRRCLVQNPTERWSMDDMLRFLAEKFPQEEKLVRDTMDSMDDDENPNLIKSTWLNAGDEALSPSGKQAIAERKEHADHDMSEAEKRSSFSSLVCPGDMSRQPLSAICLTRLKSEGTSTNEGGHDTEEDHQPAWLKVEESNTSATTGVNNDQQQSNNYSSSSSASSPKSGLFGKLKWQGGGSGGGGANNNSTTANSSSSQQQQQQQLPPVESGSGFLSSNNTKPSATSTGLDLFGVSSTSSSSAEKGSAPPSQPTTDLFGLPTNNNNNTPTAPKKKEDPFKGLFAK